MSFGFLRTNEIHELSDLLHDAAPSTLWGVVRIRAEKIFKEFLRCLRLFFTRVVLVMLTAS